MTEKLKSVWQWKFLVKTQDSYKLQAFSQSQCLLQRQSNDFEEQFKVVNNLPLLAEHYNSNISLFRDNILTEWEDPQNEGGQIIEIRINRCDLTKNDKTEKFIDKFDTLQKQELQTLFACFVVITLLNDYEGINGLYIRVKEDSFIFQFWIKSEVDPSRSDIFFEKVQQYCKDLGITKGIAKFQIERKRNVQTTPRRDLSQRTVSMRRNDEKSKSRYNQ